MLTLALGDGAELRALEPWHADEMAEHVDDIREHLKPWIPFAYTVVDAPSARKLLQRFADMQGRDEGRLYGIWIDGKLSGGTMFREFDAGTGVCEIGVWLSPHVEGRGLMTRTVRHMIDWAIRVRGMSRVEWNNIPDNERSRAVAKRLGLTREGIRRSEFLLNNQHRDSEMWSVLPDEWPGQPAPLLTVQLGDGAELRALEPWNADEFRTHVEGIRDHLKPWIPFASRVVDADTAREFLQMFADWQARDEGRLYGIWVDGALSGGTLFKDFNAAAGVCEIGVWLSPAVEGRGLITRTVRHMIDWAVLTRGMTRVEWRCAPANQRSSAVAKRLGLSHEGTLRSDFTVNGKRQDSEVWAVLADEWRAQSPS